MCLVVLPVMWRYWGAVQASHSWIRGPPAVHELHMQLQGSVRVVCNSGPLLRGADLVAECYGRRVAQLWWQLHDVWWKLVFCLLEGSFDKHVADEVYRGAEYGHYDEYGVAQSAKRSPCGACPRPAVTQLIFARSLSVRTHPWMTICVAATNSRRHCFMVFIHTQAIWQAIPRHVQLPAREAYRLEGRACCMASVITRMLAGIVSGRARSCAERTRYYCASTYVGCITVAR
jgi:hypothetical protein